MATAAELDQWRKGLHSTVPVVGAMQRRAAAGALAERRDDPDVVPVLIEALGSSDEKVAETAAEALLGLTSPKSISMLCMHWANTRDPRLSDLIVRRAYVPPAPPKLVALCALKSGAFDYLAQADGALASELLGAIEDPDPAIRQAAAKTLGGLRNPAGINAVCAIWAERRDPRLGALISAKAYIATEPLTLRILTAFKNGKSLSIDRPELVTAVARLFADPDDQVRAAALKALDRLSAGPLQDALCDAAIVRPNGEVARYCQKSGRHPSDPGKNCLFLWVTKQFDEYFAADTHFHELLKQYDRADATVRQHVLNVAKSPDARVRRFLEARKTLARCSDSEIRRAIKHWIETKNWPRLFAASLEMPLKHGWVAFRALSQSGWTSESSAVKEVLNRVFTEVKTVELPAASTSPHTSRVFKAWLAGGNSADYSESEVSNLSARILESYPAEGVSIVWALAQKAAHGSQAARDVDANPNWLIRLAGQKTGLCLRLIEDRVVDSNYWVRELSVNPGVVEFWPNRGTKEDLEELDKAPPEAQSGPYGAARRVLRAILRYRLTRGKLQDMILEAREFDST